MNWLMLYIQKIIVKINDIILYGILFKYNILFLSSYLSNTKIYKNNTNDIYSNDNSIIEFINNNIISNYYLFFDKLKLYECSNINNTYQQKFSLLPIYTFYILESNNYYFCWKKDTANKITYFTLSILENSYNCINNYINVYKKVSNIIDDTIIYNTDNCFIF